MSRMLITHPSPNLLRNLARLHLSAQPTLTLVPNVAAGRSLRQLTRRALPTLTFAQQARRHLGQAGWVPLPATDREARLRALLSQVELEYFGPLLGRPGTAAALHHIIRTLLRADAAWLPAGRGARERDLVRLHRSWVLELLRDGIYDPAVPEFFASRIALSAEPVTLSGFAYLDAAQLAYLDRLAAAGSAAFLAGSQPGELAEAQRTAAALLERGWQRQVPDEAQHLHDPRLQRTGDQAARATLRAGAGSPPELTVLALPSVVEEARTALRLVMRAHQDGGVPWHDLAIVVRDEAAYLPPLLENAERYGVPLLGSARQPLLATPLGSFMQCWVEAGLADWPFALTAQLLGHPLIELPFDLERVRRGFGRRAPGGLAAWGEGALNLHLQWPQAGHGLAFLQGVTRALDTLGVLQRQRGDAQLGAALAALQQALRPLEKLPELPRAEMLMHVKAALAEASMPMLPSRGGVRVSTPLGILGRSFHSVWMLGLSEGVFPRPASDPPLLDAQLRAFWSKTGVYLPGGIESQAIEEALFFHALACARRGLTLTRAEMVGGRRAPPSRFLQPFPGGDPFTEISAGTRQEARVLQALQGTLGSAEIQRAAELEVERESGQAEGPRLPGLVDPDAWTWSASQLHSYGACRYRWFANKVMRLEALPEPLDGLDALGCGLLYHLTLEHLLRPHLKRPHPGPDELVRQLPAALDLASAELVGRGEIELGPVWAVERGDHLRLLERAVRASDFLPTDVQVEALELDLRGQLMVDGQPWTFRGYADRVDLAPDGRRIITDYKLNTYISRVRDATGRLGTEVQLPVYLQLTGAAQARYYSLKQAKMMKVPGPEGDPQARVKAFLSQMRVDLLEGQFMAQPDPAAQACRLCDVQALCRFQAFREAEPA